MRLGVVRGALATALAIATVVGVGATADADQHPPVPTKAQVDHARAIVAQRAGDVASLRAQLAVANNQLDDASQKAEIAAEAYNGALYRLQLAQAETAKAKADAAAAAAQVEQQRAGIAALVTQSYQEGSSLGGMSAVLGADGVDSLMTRVGAVQSAADSMQARYDQYTALNVLARVATAKAERIERAQTRLTEKAATLRDAAAQAANEAQTKAAQITQQRHDLILKLAAAQKISVHLAVRRQQHLERVAEAKAAAAAAAQAEADADKAKHDADQTDQELQNLGPEGGWDLPGLAGPNGTPEGAAKAIQFAKAQLGDPYLWAAAGPDRWDCSGLTMMSWKAGGVALPHYSAAQYQLTVHIGVADLRPGDLVFWGTSPNTIHHVAMYIGNGQIIQAPRTGSYVEISGMYDWIPPNFFGRP